MTLDGGARRMLISGSCSCLLSFGRPDLTPSVVPFIVSLLTSFFTICRSRAKVTRFFARLTFPISGSHSVVDLLAPGDHCFALHHHTRFAYLNL